MKTPSKSTEPLIESSERKIIDEIIKEIGNRKIFTEEKKRAFAKAITKEMPYILPISKALETQKIDFENLRETSYNAKNSFQALHRLIFENLDAGVIYNQVIRRFSATDIDKIDINYMLLFLEKFDDELKKCKSPQGNKKTKGQAFTISKTIALQYKEHFGADPSANNSDSLSPFERVCAVLEKHYNISIPKHSRIKAVEFAKTQKSI